MVSLSNHEYLHTHYLVRARDNMIDGLFRANASRVNLARATGQVETLR